MAKARSKGKKLASSSGPNINDSAATTLAASTTAKLPQETTNPSKFRFVPQSFTPSSTSNPKRILRPVILSPLSVKNLQKEAPKSSPIKRGSLPSPSPERYTMKSSPIKKRVNFSENLVNENSSPIKTPMKSILKIPTAHNSRLPPPVMNSLTPSIKSNFTPALEDFWIPGNIPVLPESASLQEELTFFKSLLHGAITNLNVKNCSRRFEIYATLSLLLKDLNDRKMAILLNYLPDLLLILKKDLIELDAQILETENADAFLTRINVQLVKVLAALLSNIKIIRMYWSRTNNALEIAKYFIQYSTCIIQTPKISKSLLSSNIQLLKEMKFHSYLNQEQQEKLLYSVLNMKYFNSSSILVEKIHCLKSLIVKLPIMMSKNVKAWLGFLFNCLCDFTSQLYLKTLTVAVVTLLEISKVYTNDSKVQFEIRYLLRLPIKTVLNIELTESMTTSSAQVDLNEPLKVYILNRIMELVSKEETGKIGLDYWFGLTLLVYHDEKYLNENSISFEDKWFGFLISLKTSPGTSQFVWKYYRIFAYLLLKNQKAVSPQKLKPKLILIFKIFKTKINKQLFKSMDPRNFLNLASITFYSILNNKAYDFSIEGNHYIWEDFFLPLLEKIHDLSLVNSEINSYKTLLMTQLFASSSLSHLGNSANNSLNHQYQSMKVLTSFDEFDLKKIEPLNHEFIFDNYMSIFTIFKLYIWFDKSISLKVKLNVLSNLVSRIKISASNIDQQQSDSKKNKILNSILEEYNDFLEYYFIALNEFTESSSKLEFINRFTLLIKANLGTKVFYKFSNNSLSYNHRNIYSTIIKHSLDYKGKDPEFRIQEVLKFLLNHIKSHQYKFFESLMLFQSEILNQYISNSLESKILKDLSNPDLKSISCVLKYIPKTKELLKNIISTIIHKDIFIQLWEYMRICEWKEEEIKSLINLIYFDDFEGNILKPLILTDIVNLFQSSSNVLNFMTFLLSEDKIVICFALKKQIIDKIFQNSKDENFLKFLREFLEFIKYKSSYSAFDEMLFYCFDSASKSEYLEDQPHSAERINDILMHFVLNEMNLEFLTKVEAFVNQDEHLKYGANSNISQDTVVLEPQTQSQSPSQSGNSTQTQIKPADRQTQSSRWKDKDQELSAKSKINSLENEGNDSSSSLPFLGSDISETQVVDESNESIENSNDTNHVDSSSSVESIKEDSNENVNKINTTQFDLEVEDQPLATNDILVEQSEQIQTASGNEKEVVGLHGIDSLRRLEDEAEKSKISSANIETQVIENESQRGDEQEITQEDKNNVFLDPSVSSPGSGSYDTGPIKPSGSKELFEPISESKHRLSNVESIVENGNTNELSGKIQPESSPLKKTLDAEDEQLTSNQKRQLESHHQSLDNSKRKKLNDFSDDNFSTPNSSPIRVTCNYNNDSDNINDNSNNNDKVQTTFFKIKNYLDLINLENLKDLDSEQIYEIENNLLTLMINMRSHRSRPN